MKLSKIIAFEYLIAFTLTAFFYGRLDFSWLSFIMFILLPDISMLGYLWNTKIGALFYNIGHSYVFPALLMMIAFMTSTTIFLIAALIWLAHIFLDRALGYGLKYDEGFKKTHLQRIM
ncbi:DUF4260 domain-containing protein [Lysinibacillus macroides]|uniref:Membrane protein n=1 Tax=Lysinibacillus macroides TaxID=33935 RepID=A0A0N0UWH3_9BACI|nr:membrane protein [Lysinibacillus macroides]QPR70361.1 DUF4260 domain-containing protein [Lysinibacillus macroides]